MSGRTWRMSGMLLDGTQLQESCGGRLRVGAAGSEGTPAIVESDVEGLRLRAVSSDDDALDALDGPVMLWWPSGTGRHELQAEARPGTDGADDGEGELVVTWPPRKVQHRRHRRASLEVPAWLTGFAAEDPDGTVACTTSDVSAGGVRLEVPELVDWCRPAAPVAVCLLLDDGPLVAAGTIRRRARHLVTVRFDTMATKDEDRVSAAVLDAEQRRML